MVELINNIQDILPNYNPNLVIEKIDEGGFLSKLEKETLVRMGVAANAKKVFEFGTNTGQTTEILAKYFEQVYTIDFYKEMGQFISPVQINEVPSIIDVGKYCKLPNVVQLYGDTLSKNTRLELMTLNHNFDIVIVDGGHDYLTCLNDTLLALVIVKPGGLIFWHDYKDENIGKDVMKAVNLVSGIIGNIYHIAKTWLAFYPVPEKKEPMKTIPRESIPQAIKIGNRVIKYPDKRFHNLSLDTERTIEIPLIWDEVIKYSPSEVLEIGNVLGQYIKRSHDVIDLQEQRTGIITGDIRTYQSEKKYKLIVSITTLEHVGDGRDGHDVDELGIINAINNMLGLLTDSGRIIFTVPVGQNPYMDNLFKEHKIVCDSIYAYKRIDALNNWLRLPYDDIKNSELYAPYWGTANASLLCEIYKKGNS